MGLWRQISELAKQLGPDSTVYSTNQVNKRKSELKSVVDPKRPSYVVSMYGNADYGKHIKFDMPRFNGTNPEEWIFMARIFFIFHNILEDHKLIIASFNMQEEALKWFLWMEASNYLTT